VMGIFVVVLEAKRADKDENHLQVVIVDAETSSEAISKAIEGAFSSIEDLHSCKYTIIANIKTPHVHVDVF